MSSDTVEQIVSSPFPAIAAEVRWDEEKKYGSPEGLQERLAGMTKAGIISEVLDLVEALEMPSTDATEASIITYENAARSATPLSTFWIQQGNAKLAEMNELQIQNDRTHAKALRNGETTISQELEARSQQRQAIGFPDNAYTTLLSKPVFPK